MAPRYGGASRAAAVTAARRPPRDCCCRERDQPPRVADGEMPAQRTSGIERRVARAWRGAGDGCGAGGYLGSKRWLLCESACG